MQQIELIKNRVSKTVFYKDLGRIDFKKAWDIQEELFNRNIEIKNKSKNKEVDSTKNHLLICEHSHVYTLGKSGKVQNLLINEEYLTKIGANFYKINRGGDITYHGLGQIVIYPILDLENFGIGLKKYIILLEEVVILTLANYGIEAQRIDEATGVWVFHGNITKPRKICAIGVRSSRYITMHGLAFNVNTDLNYYNYINPCGFTDKGVTSMKEYLGEEVPIKEVQKVLIEKFVQVFGIDHLIV